MALNTGSFLKTHHNLRHTMSTDATNSDATLAIDGYKNLYIKIKSFPDPGNNVSDSIEVPLPQGNTYYKAGQAKTSFQGSCSFIETEDRTVQTMLDEIKLKGGYFDAWLYQGTPDHYVNRKRLIKCVFVQSAPTQRDFQSNTEVLVIEGDIYGNYFGEMETGDVDTLMGGY